MNYRQHSFVGLGSLIITLPLFHHIEMFTVNIITIAYIAVYTIIGSLAPDIDHPKAYLSRILYALIGIGTIILIFKRILSIEDYKYIPIIVIPLLLLGISKLIYRLYGHRTITHSLLIVLLMSLILIATSFLIDIYTIYFYCFISGYLSHILADTFTGNGIPYFYPFSTRKYKYMFIPQKHKKCKK